MLQRNVMLEACLRVTSRAGTTEYYIAAGQLGHQIIVGHVRRLEALHLHFGLLIPAGGGVLPAAQIGFLSRSQLLDNLVQVEHLLPLLALQGEERESRSRAGIRSD